MPDPLTDDFLAALRDYAYLLNHTYPKKEALKLVGDRFRLDRMQRLLLNRGVFGPADSGNRSITGLSDVTETRVHIDALNVLFTIGNYLLGRPVFISNDGFLRDGGEITGKLHRDRTFGRAAEMLMKHLSEHKDKEYVFLVDKPVQGSGEIRQLLEARMNDHGIKGKVSLVRDPDPEMIRLSGGVIATSDSEVIDQFGGPVLDLAREVLETNFSPDFIDLASLLA